MSMEDYKKLVNRLRDEPKESRKAVLSIYDLCVDAACAIESLLDKLKYAEAERDAVTRHMIELEQEVCRLKSRLAAYEDTGLEPEDLKKAFNETAIRKLAAQALNTTPDHLRDLIQAAQDGRLVVLPCKVGATVYGHSKAEVFEYKVAVMSKKYYIAHEVAELLAEVIGDRCACNVNGNDEWLPMVCDFGQTVCPNVYGVACWEQYLKHHGERKEGADND